MPWGMSKSRTSYKLAPFFIAVCMLPPSKKPFETIFRNDGTPSMNDPESMIKITCMLFFRISIKLTILKASLMVTSHLNITQEIIIDPMYNSVDNNIIV